MSSVAANIHNTLGAMYIGLIISIILYGVSCIQTWQYFMSNAKDSRWVKLLVIGVLMSETAHLVLISTVMYFYTISNFSNPLALSKLYKPIVAQVIPNGFAALLVQTFFAVRIWRLSGKSLLHTIPVAILIVVQWAVNIGYTTFTIRIVDLTHTSKGWTGALDATSAITDVAISAVLIMLLSGSRTEYEHTNNLLNKLILFSLNTGLVTTVCAIGALTFYYALPNTFIYIGIYWMLPRLYANSLLATLNARAYLRGQSQPQISYSLEDRRVRTFDNLGSARPQQNDISVHIDTLKETSGDSKSDFDLTHKGQSMV